MLLPAFSLPAANRQGEISLRNYKPRENLALLFLQDLSQFASLLNAVAQRYSDYREFNAEVLVISGQASEQLTPFPFGALPFPVLVDNDGELRRKCLGSEQEFQAVALIADRWGEVYGRLILQPDRAAADEEELRKWLQFVDLQCEECFPPEWPAV
jgi:peroxiredoxin